MPEDDQKPKISRSTRTGVIAGLVALPVFVIAHMAFGFPEMLFHALLLPVLIGLVARFQSKLNSSEYWRRD